MLFLAYKIHYQRVNCTHEAIRVHQLHSQTCMLASRRLWLHQDARRGRWCSPPRVARMRLARRGSRADSSESQLFSSRFCEALQSVYCHLNQSSPRPLVVVANSLKQLVAIWQLVKYAFGMPALFDSLRQAIHESEQSRYQIAKGSGIAASQLARLANGQRGLSVESAERLADYLGLQITIKPKPTKGH